VSARRLGRTHREEARACFAWLIDALRERLKLLLIVSLAYAFLLSLLDPLLKSFRDALLPRFCPRQISGAGNPRLRFTVSGRSGVPLPLYGPPSLALRESSG